MHVFVTGGAGFIGSHCCKWFAEKGWTITVYDNLSRGWRDFVKWGKLVEGDILDQERLNEAIASAKPDIVAHFAALAYVGESVQEPDIYYQTNVVGALNLLNAMKKNGVDKLVFSSTCATYGNPQKFPMDESHPQHPINPYGWSKFMVERILADYQTAFGLRSVILRYFNAAGSDPDFEIGERHEPETHVIPLAIRGAMDGDYIFTLYGDDFDTRDGTAVRDYVHVSDLASAHALAIEYLAGGGRSDAFNLGTGTGTTVNELADTVEKVTGRSVKRKIGGRRTGDPDILTASAGKSERILNWRPVRSDINLCVEDAYGWYLKTRSS